MNTKSMYIMIVAVTLGLAGVSFADVVIGNWEDSNDGWVVFTEAPDGTTMHPFKGNATLGQNSLKLTIPSGWQKAIMRVLTGEPNLLKALGKAKQLKVDVTLKSREWDLGSGWVKPIECIIVQSDMGHWQQIDTADSNNTWNGQEDKTVTVTFDIPPQTPPDLTRAHIIIVTQYTDVNKPGSFYLDNVRLITEEPKKAAEPNKPK